MDKTENAQGTTPVQPNTTLTVGYYNAERCAIHVVISELNQNLRLEPGQYVEDTAGRRINDPFFDRYKSLAKEVGTEPVPLLLVARPTAMPAAPRDGHAVRQITEFKLDAHGHRQPVMPQPINQPAPDPSSPPWRGMSVEEARRMGLIRRTREVPEDFGVPDTDGLPPQNIPEMRIARDTAQGGRTQPAPAQPLPQAAAALSDDSRTQRTAAQRTQLQQRLQEAQASAPSDDDVPPEVVNPISTIPTNVVTALSSTEPEPLPEPVTDTPAPAAAAAPEQVRVRSTPQPLPPKRRFICQADGRVFDFRSQLEMHVKRKFPGLYDELMAPYPKEA